MAIQPITNKADFATTPAFAEGDEGIFENTTASGDFVYEMQRHYIKNDGGLTWEFISGIYASKVVPASSGLTAPLGPNHLFIQFNAAGDEIEKTYRPTANAATWIELPVTTGGGNVNAPTATSPQNFFVNEDVAIGSAVGTVTATPAASGPIVYVMAGNDEFKIDSATGAITTIAELNYATASSYALTAYAVEGEAAKPITVNINVNQVQDVAIFLTANNAVLSRNGSTGVNTTLVGLGAAVGDLVIYRSNATNADSILSEWHQGVVKDVAGNLTLEHICGKTISYAIPTNTFTPEGLNHEYLHVANGGDFTTTAGDNSYTRYTQVYGYSGVSGGFAGSNPRWEIED